MSLAAGDVCYKVLYPATKRFLGVSAVGLFVVVSVSLLRSPVDGHEARTEFLGLRALKASVQFMCVDSNSFRVWRRR